MLNQFVVVGRLQEIRKEENIIVLAHQSSYKNTDGEYEKFTNEYLISTNILGNNNICIKNGDLVGVKGHIRENKLYAEKISFLSSEKED